MPNSGCNDINTPTTYQSGAPINIQHMYFLKIPQFLKSIKKLPLDTPEVFSILLNIPDSNVPTRSKSNKNPNPPPTKYAVCQSYFDIQFAATAPNSPTAATIIVP